MFFILPLSPAHYRHLRHYRHKQANCLRFLCDARCDDKFCVTQRADVLPLTQSCPHEMGKVAWRSHDERGITRSGRVLRGVPPQSVSLSLTDSSPASGGAFNSLSLFANAHSQLPLRGSLLVRFISLHIKPALKGEVGFAKQKPEGLHRDCSCLSQPLSHGLRRASSPSGEPYAAGIT